MASTIEEIAAGSALAAVGAAMWLAVARQAWKQQRVRVAADRRSRTARTTAIEASLEDEAFSPEVVRAAVESILGTAEVLWRGDPPPDVSASAERGAPANGGVAVIGQWADAVASRVGPRARIVGRPRVDFLRVVNRPGVVDDRMVVRVCLCVRAPRRIVIARRRPPHRVNLDERWTLGHDGATWRLLSVFADPLAACVLTSPLIAGAWDDEERLREQTLAALADSEADADPSGLVGADLPAERQLRELAAVDSRFDPALVDARIRHLVEAWEETAVAGPECLDDLALPSAIDALLTPAIAGGARLVIHDPTIDWWEPSRLELSSIGAELTVAIRVSAVRFLLNPQSGELAGGSTEARHDIDMTWTLGLPTRGANIWRLTATTDPAATFLGPDSPEPRLRKWRYDEHRRTTDGGRPAA